VVLPALLKLTSSKHATISYVDSHVYWVIGVCGLIVINRATLALCIDYVLCFLRQQLEEHHAGPPIKPFPAIQLLVQLIVLYPTGQFGVNVLWLVETEHKCRHEQ